MSVYLGLPGLLSVLGPTPRLSQLSCLVANQFLIRAYAKTFLPLFIAVHKLKCF